MVALVGLVAAGCSGGGGQGRDGRLGVMQQGTLTFAMSAEYRPFSYFEGSKLLGFDKDIGDELANRLELEPNAETGAFDTLIQGLQSMRYDTIIGSMTPTKRRKQAVDFTDGYYASGAQLFVRTNSDCQSPSNLQGVEIGVARGTTYADYANEQDWVSNTFTYASDVHALTDLDAGRLDGVITDKLVGLYQIKQAGRDLRACGGLLFEEQPAIAVRKGNDALLAAINEALAAMKQDGTYTELSQKWFGRNIL